MTRSFGQDAQTQGATRGCVGSTSVQSARAGSPARMCRSTIRLSADHLILLATCLCLSKDFFARSMASRCCVNAGVIEKKLTRKRID